MQHEISMQDIHGYLATKEKDEVIGLCMNGDACLAHNTLVWKYGLENADVIALCTYALINDTTVNFPQDVEQAVDTFDNLKTGDSPVTKAEFMAALAAKDLKGVANER